MFQPLVYRHSYLVVAILLHSLVTTRAMNNIKTLVHLMMTLTLRTDSYVYHVSNDYSYKSSKLCGRVSVSSGE